MDVNQILEQLRHQRSQLDAAISALEGGQTAPRRGRPPKSASAAPAKRGRRTMSPAARRKISQMMKARWAARKKQQTK